MYKTIRLLIAISLGMGVVLLAQSQVAWADPALDQSLSAQDPALQSIAAAARDDDCEKDKDKDKKKNKKKDKDKDKCKGTVKPPRRDLIIPVTGEYSVGGFCTLTVELNDPDITLDAQVETPLPGELPEEVQQIRQGCLLTYFSSNQRMNLLSAESGNTTICFSALPGKQMLLYFYDIYSSKPKWLPLETSSQDGIACGPGKASGVYVATFKKP